MFYSPIMVDSIDISAVVAKLTTEFDELIDERREVRGEIAKLTARAEEVERKLQGIQQTLQGLCLYSKAQDPPTELTKKTASSIEVMIESMKNSLGVPLLFGGGEVPKTLSECCRDILRQKGDWMSAVQVREALNAAGFDFSNYTSNPLSSIHTTLKRLPQEEFETETRSEGQVYRVKKKPKSLHALDPVPEMEEQ
jgi:cob(I)alamin adenosyltransferase